MGSHIRTSYTSNMFSLKLVFCVCIFFFIGMEAAPKPKPKAEPKPQPKAEPKPYPPIGYPPYYNLPDANPGPWNWNGFPPTRGANPWQLYWNGSPNLNRGSRRRRRYSNKRPQVGDKFIQCLTGPSTKHGAPDGTKGCIVNIWPRGPWGIYGKCVKVPTRPEYSSCKLCDYGEDCRFVEGTWPHYRIKS